MIKKTPQELSVWLKDLEYHRKGKNFLLCSILLKGFSITCINLLGILDRPNDIKPELMKPLLQSRLDCIYDTFTFWRV